MTILTVKCSNCGKTMNMGTKNPNKARKKCNYCGKSFPIHKNVNDSQIVQKPKRNTNIEVKGKLPNGQEFEETKK